MSEKRTSRFSVYNLRLEPDRRLCPKYDATSIKLFRAPSRDDMGMRVLDNCAEEHIM